MAAVAIGEIITVEMKSFLATNNSSRLKGMKYFVFLNIQAKK